MEQKNKKKILVFKRIRLEQNQQILIFSNRILIIGSQYATKQP